MTTRDIHIPKAKEAADATGLGKDGEEPKGHKYWEEKEKESRAKREFEESERQARLARANETDPPEAPFQVKGEVNLGKFDFQEQQRELKETIAGITQEAKTRVEALEQSNAHYRDEVSKIQISMVESTLKAQIDSLQRTIVANNAPGGNQLITERIGEITQIAGLLGYQKPDPASAQDALPANLQLQMLKMDMEEKGRARQFEWDKIESERNWNIQIRKLELEADGRKQELSLEREKRATFISPFESIGAAIARGLVDMGAETSPDSTETRETKVRKKASKPSKEAYKLQAGENDQGTIACPECQEPIAIAPKAKSAFCPSCEATVEIERIPDEVPAPRGLV